MCLLTAVFSPFKLLNISIHTMLYGVIISNWNYASYFSSRTSPYVLCE